MGWLVKALLGEWFLLGPEDRRKQKRGLVAVDCAAGGMTGNSIVRWWIAETELVAGGIATGKEVGR